METESTRTEHLVWHFRQAPFQLAHMRTLAENTISAQDTEAVRVSGSSEKARLPYRVEPADDADLLYSTLVLFTLEVAERTGNPAPRPVRDRMWHGRDEPQGLPVCTPTEAFALAGEIVRYLEACAPQIAHLGELNDAPDDLIALIRKMRARYPQSEPKFRAYRPRPCPTCGERTIRPLWDANGLAGATCDTCGQKWERSP